MTIDDALVLGWPVLISALLLLFVWSLDRGVGRLDAATRDRPDDPR